MTDGNKFKVSLIVPVYNAGRYLSEMFSSVKRQSIGFESIQVILVDDCSTDGGFEWIERMAERYSNVTALRTPAASGSASVPRNMGLDAAGADCVMFLDADDVLRPNAVGLLYGLITEKRVDLADAAFAEHGKKDGIDSRYIGRREGLYRLKEDVDTFFPISHPIVTKLFSRRIIDDNNLRFDRALRNGEDSLFLYEYLKHADTAWHVNDVIYEYRVRRDSVSHSREERYFAELADACDAVQSALVGTEYFGYYERFVEEIASASLDILCDAGEIDDERCRALLTRWYPLIKAMADNGLRAKTAAADILTRDAERGDVGSYERDFFALRRLYDERRTLVNEFTSSLGWKVITGINRLLGRG